jgi:alpha-beta hydrolase superfamily lysophospholipase
MQLSTIRRTETLISGARGNDLFRRDWLPSEPPERAVLLVHGLAEHSGRYEGLAAWLAERGCAVHAYDHHGHGRSQGMPGHLRQFSDYLDDLEEVLRFVAKRHPDLPRFLVGHSLGGLIVSSLASQRRPDVAGIVTSGAAVQTGPAVSRASMFGARMLSRPLPKLRLSARLDPAGLCSDPEVVRRYVEDPLVFQKITLSTARELFAAMGAAIDGAHGIDRPVLMLHGEVDPICAVAGSRAFFDQLRVTDRVLKTYPGLLHEIFNEPTRERVYEDVLAWLRQRKG